MDKEQKAKEYADSIPQFDDRRRYCYEDFIAGWDEALKSQWVKVEDRLPKEKEDKLKKKAIEAHRQSCPQWNCCKHRVGKPTCTKECGYMEKFILLLNN